MMNLWTADQCGEWKQLAILSLHGQAQRQLKRQFIHFNDVLCGNLSSSFVPVAHNSSQSNLNRDLTSRERWEIPTGSQNLKFISPSEAII